MNAKTPGSTEQVLTALRQSGTMSIAQVCKATGLGEAAARGSLSRLRKECLISRHEDTREGGKRKWLYTAASQVAHPYRGIHYYVASVRQPHHWHVFCREVGRRVDVRMTQEPRTIDIQNHYARELDKIALKHPGGKRG
jgi:Fe2+ or Zn2+ uptake regulation protein